MKYMVRTVIIIVLFTAAFNVAYARTPGEFVLEDDGSIILYLDAHIRDCIVSEGAGVTPSNHNSRTNSHNSVTLWIANSVQYGQICSLRSVSTFTDLQGKIHRRIPGDFLVVDSYYEGEYIGGYWLDYTIDYCLNLSRSGITSSNYLTVQDNNNILEIILTNSDVGYICAVTGYENHPM